MNYSVSTLLPLLGSLVALNALVAGDPLRRDDRSFVHRLTPRILMMFILLGLALATATVDLVRAPSVSVLAVAAAVLLTLGTGGILWTCVRAPRYRGNETLRDRLPVSSRVALGVLSASGIVDLLDRNQTAIGRQVDTDTTVAILGWLGIGLLGVSLVAVVSTLRSGHVVQPGPGSLFRRLSQRARGTLVILGLALAVIGCVSLLRPTPGVLLGLVLLIVGTVAGLLGYAAGLKTASSDEPAPWGIAPRVWVALGLLGLSGVVLGTEQRALMLALQDPHYVANRRLQDIRAEIAAKEVELDRLRPNHNPAGIVVVDLARLYRQSGSPETPAGERDAATAEIDRRERELAELRAKREKLEAEVAKITPPGQTPAPSPEPDLPAGWQGSPAGGRDARYSEDGDFPQERIGKRRVRR